MTKRYPKSPGACGCLFALLLCATLARAEGVLPEGRKIAENVNARDEGIQVTRNLTMEMIDRAAKSRTRETIGYRKYFGEEKRTVIFYLSPSNIKDTSFLTYDYPDANTDDDQWLYLPAVRKVRRISASERGDYFLGTDFSYEDIKKEGKFSLEDYTFKTIGEDEVDGHPCFVIEATPVDETTANELGYGKVRAWVDPEIWMMRRSEFWDVRGNSLKTIRNLEIRRVDGIWTAHRLEADNHKTGHRTVFIFSGIDYASKVDDGVFRQDALRRGSPRR